MWWIKESNSTLRRVTKRPQIKKCGSFISSGKIKTDRPVASSCSVKPLTMIEVRFRVNLNPYLSDPARGLTMLEMFNLKVKSRSINPRFDQCSSDVWVRVSCLKDRTSSNLWPRTNRLDQLRWPANAYVTLTLGFVSGFRPKAQGKTSNFQTFSSTIRSEPSQSRFDWCLVKVCIHTN